MNSVRHVLRVGPWVLTLLATLCHGAEIGEVITEQQAAAMVLKKGIVTFQKRDNPVQVVQQLPHPVNLGDTLTTSNASWAFLYMRNSSPLRLRPQTRLQLQPRPGATNQERILLIAGQLYLVNRGRGVKADPFITPHAEGTLKGTEFLLAVSPDGSRTDITMFDGEVQLTTIESQVRTNIQSEQQATVLRGGEIQVRPILQATNIVQWWLYYPAILDLEELQLVPAAQGPLAASLAAYRTGDLPRALEHHPGYPTPPDPATDSERFYLAGLLLAVGAVERAEELLARSDTNAPPARALRAMIAAVSDASVMTLSSTTQRPVPDSQSSILDSPSELLAASYTHQASHHLEAALKSARAATERSPTFGFAWARVAELEFSFGHTRAARAAVEHALSLSPSNAQAHTVHGFLLAAGYKLHDAIVAFDRAIQIDPALGNAWLGRGLCKRRAGWFRKSQGSEALIENSEISDWLLDLQTAAALEPTRSVLRSYAGKAYADAGNAILAQKELSLAQRLDTNDPTPWLYAALTLWRERRFNEAIDDLERSIEQNDNRAVHRSWLLLDEDRAVRSASLAKIYRDAGLGEVAVREAARGVTHDYANYASHLFLAESFDTLRDPTRFNLRYETVWFNELLLANLLAPVGAGTFSQNISQQEYGRLLEANRLGLTSATEYRSDGQWRERATHSATLGRLGYALDVDYQHNDGVRPNNDLERLEWYSTFKFQLTRDDMLFALTKVQDYESGDNFQYYNPHVSDPDFRYEEQQLPIAMGGYRHEWSPGVQTLAVAGRLENDQQFTDQNAPRLFLLNTNPPQAGVSGLDFGYRGQFEAFFGELNQIIRTERNTLVAGAGFQSGTFETANAFSGTDPWGNAVAVVDHVADDFQRTTLYAYDQYTLRNDLALTAGVAYDDLTYPENFRNPPVSDGDTSVELLQPKAALVWSPLRQMTLRGMYARALTGVTLDQSYRLEPSQLAGFSQSFRTVIPESLVGSVAAQKLDLWGVAADVKLASRTYLGLQAMRTQSAVDQSIGVFKLPTTSGPSTVGTVEERLRFDETSIAFAVDQLLGDEWSLGARYRFTHTVLDDELVDDRVASLSLRADLHELTARLHYSHASGLFARAEGVWLWQQNGGDLAPPDSHLWQMNCQLGYRLPRHRAEVSVGILNLFDQDYRLNPLNGYPQLPFERVFFARLLVNF